MENIYKQEVLVMKAAVCQTKAGILNNVNFFRHKPFSRSRLFFHFSKVNDFIAVSVHFQAEKVAKIIFDVL